MSAFRGGATGPPLHGVRILDLTRLLPGAYATLLLANLGADVVKVEDPRGGDGMRGLAARLMPSRDDRSSFFELLNRNKRSITLNLRSLDSIQLAVALSLNDPAEPIEFVCADQALCAIAKAEGVSVLIAESNDIHVGDLLARAYRIERGSVAGV